MEEKDIPESTEEIVEQHQEKKENPDNQTPEDVVPEGKKERTLFMFMRVCRALLRFFERMMMKSRQRRLAKRMDTKK